MTRKTKVQIVANGIAVAPKFVKSRGHRQACGISRSNGNGLPSQLDFRPIPSPPRYLGGMGSGCDLMSPMTSQTTAPIRACDITVSPEFVDSKGLRSLFGISRSHGYALADRGLVRTVCLRKPGAIRGKRLWVAASVRAYLQSCADDRSLIPPVEANPSIGDAGNNNTQD